MSNNIIKGDLYYADLGETVGSEQSGCRPVLIIQNNVGNRYSPTVIVSPLTKQYKKMMQPTHVALGRRFVQTGHYWLVCTFGILQRFHYHKSTNNEMEGSI